MFGFGILILVGWIAMTLHSRARGKILLSSDSHQENRLKVFADASWKQMERRVSHTERFS